MTCEQLEILAAGDGTIVVLRRGSGDGLGVDVVRTEVSSDGVTVGLVKGNVDIELPNSLHEVLFKPVSACSHLCDGVNQGETYSWWARKMASK